MSNIPRREEKGGKRDGKKDDVYSLRLHQMTAALQFSALLSGNPFGEKRQVQILSHGTRLVMKYKDFAVASQVS